MEKISIRPIITKKTICKSTHSFGFSDATSLPQGVSPQSSKLSVSQNKYISTNYIQESPSRKLSKIYISQGSLFMRQKSPRKIVAEQKALWREKLKSEANNKRSKYDKIKENLKMLQEKSKILLEHNLKKKLPKTNVLKDLQANSLDIKQDGGEEVKDENNLSTAQNDSNYFKNTSESNNVCTSKIASIDGKSATVDENSDTLEDLSSENHISTIRRENSPTKEKYPTSIEEKAATTLQKCYRGYVVRKNIKSHEKKNMQSSVVTNTTELHEKSLNTHAKISDLCVNYPYNILSSVKKSIFIASHPDGIGNYNSEVSNPMHDRLSHSDVNESLSAKVFMEKSVITQVSTHSQLNIATTEAASFTKNHNIISGLKSSLEDIQKLTSNFTFDNFIFESDSKFSDACTNTSHMKENNLNAPEVNLIWSRHTNKITKSPNFLLNSFQDELNLLESFNDSLRQVQHIEKSLTSIKKDETDSEKEDNSSHKLSKINLLGNEVPFSNKVYCNGSYQTSLSSIAKENMPQNDKIIVSQNENLTHNLTDISDVLISGNNSVTENKINNCTSSLNISTSDEKHIFNYYDNKTVDVTTRLNKFCLCLVSQYMEDENVRLEYMNTLLKVREKTLLDATRNELLCLEMLKKYNQSQIPLLKKKQRGLLLKLQQERNEIKHIKKFQQERSQERKASLKRQLKHLKQILACDNVLKLSVKERNKNSSVFLHTSTNSVNSPLKGINITLSNDTRKNDDCMSKIWEGLEKRRKDLDDQKGKMQDLLQLNLSNVFDPAEMKVIEDKLSTLPKDLINNNIDDKFRNIMNNQNSIVNHSHDRFSTDKTYLKMDNNYKACKCVNGTTLNTLWEKITGHKSKKFENDQIYNMSKDSLDLFFNDAKQVAISNMLNSLQNNNNNSVQEEVPQPVPEKHSITTSSQIEKSNKIENTSFLNNLLKSEGRQLADLISSDKVAQQEMKSVNNDSFINSNATYCIDGNDNSEPSETSKSTAHSLVEELSYLYSSTDNLMGVESDVKESQYNMLGRSSHSTENNDDGIKNNSDSDHNLTKLHSIQGRDLKEFSLSVTMNTSQEVLPSDEKLISSKTDLPSECGVEDKKHCSDHQSVSSYLNCKQPVNGDFLSGSWESISPSPDQSPRDSPTGEYSPASATLTLCHYSEAEELRRKQLAIELEIKALEQQQTHLPYCIMREIPDKPPPPYIPPTDETKVLVSPEKISKPQSPPSISNVVELICSWFCSKLPDVKLSACPYEEYYKDNRFIGHFKDRLLIFDLCYELFEMEYAQLLNYSKETLPWEYKDEMYNDKCTDNSEICNRMQNKVKELLGIEVTSIRENLIISWAQKRQDFVNNLLIKELHSEEADWLDIEPFEMSIKNNLVDSILDSLISELCCDLESIEF